MLSKYFRCHLPILFSMFLQIALTKIWCYFEASIKGSRNRSWKIFILICDFYLWQSFWFFCHCSINKSQCFKVESFLEQHCVNSWHLKFNAKTWFFSWWFGQPYIYHHYLFVDKTVLSSYFGLWHNFVFRIALDHSNNVMLQIKVYFSFSTWRVSKTFLTVDCWNIFTLFFILFQLSVLV